MNKIEKNMVVTLRYKLHDPDGNLLDDGAEPITYMHGGYNEIFLPVENALTGKQAGDKITIKLQPEDAFGEYNIDLLQIEPLENLPESLEVGMMVEGTTREDDQEESLFFTVTEIAGGKAVLDANHPLAGMALVFSAMVDNVRPASAAEIEQAELK